MSKVENQSWTPPTGKVPGADIQRDADTPADVEARIAVCEELWGPDHLVPGQNSSTQPSAGTVMSCETGIHCLIGVGLLGVRPDYGAFAHETDIFEGDPAVAAFHQAARPPAEARARLIVWDGAAAPEPGRYSRISTRWALAAVTDPAGLATQLASALQPGGELHLDELWVTDADVGRRLGGVLGLWRADLAFPKRKKVLESLFGQLVLREVTERASALKREIRDALADREDMQLRMKNLPDEVRRLRAPALARELERALILFDALNRGQVAASRHIFQRPA